MMSVTSTVRHRLSASLAAALAFAASAGAEGASGPDAISWAAQHPHSIVVVLSTAESVIPEFSQPCVRIAVRNVSSERIAYWNLAAPLDFDLKIVHGQTKLAPRSSPHTLVQAPHHPRFLKPGETFQELDDAGRACVPITAWGYDDLPAGTYVLTVYPRFTTNHAVQSNTITIAVP